jgi:mannose-6-phosphate isomerase class I
MCLVPLLLLLPLPGEVLEIQAASNNTIKGGLTGDPTDRQALVDIVTAGKGTCVQDLTFNTCLAWV